MKEIDLAKKKKKTSKISKKRHFGKWLFIHITISGELFGNYLAFLETMVLHLLLMNYILVLLPSNIYGGLFAVREFENRHCQRITQESNSNSLVECLLKCDRKHSNVLYGKANKKCFCVPSICSDENKESPIYPTLSGLKYFENQLKVKSSAIFATCESMIWSLTSNY